MLAVIAWVVGYSMGNRYKQPSASSELPTLDNLSDETSTSRGRGQGAAVAKSSHTKKIILEALFFNYDPSSSVKSKVINKISEKN